MNGIILHVLFEFAAYQIVNSPQFRRSVKFFRHPGRFEGRTVSLQKLSQNEWYCRYNYDEYINFPLVLPCSTPRTPKKNFARTKNRPNIYTHNDVVNSPCQVGGWAAVLRRAVAAHDVVDFVTRSNTMNDRWADGHFCGWQIELIKKDADGNWIAIGRAMR